MPWLCVSIDTVAAQIDSLSEQLTAVGAVAVTVRPGSSAEPVLEPGPADTPLWDSARLEALFPVAADLSPLRSIIEGSGRLFDVVFVEDQDWSNVWRQAVVLQHYAGRLSVVPRDHPADDLTGVVLRLDPGLAFGTGAHPTTAMCLDALAGRELKGLRVADIGCGSGILGIAALLLGAGSVLAVDHDPQALLATRANAAYNRALGDRLSVADTLPAAGRWDIVVANILANPLVDLAERLCALLKRKGVVILSGILEAELDAVLAAYPELKFAPAIRRQGWVCVEGTRRSV
jgi:ribosomal protein L11 methyltransferase